VLTEAIVAANDALEAPAATVTLLGTVTALLLLARTTPVPVDRAGELRETVQVVMPAPVNELPLQENELIAGAIVEADPLT